MMVSGAHAVSALPMTTQKPNTADQLPLEETQKVRPIDPGADGTPELPMFGQAPDKFWRAARGEPDPATHIAPPSIMQLKISKLLEEQAPQTEDDPLPSAEDTGPADVRAARPVGDETALVTDTSRAAQEQVETAPASLPVATGKPADEPGFEPIPGMGGPEPSKFEPWPGTDAS